MAKPKLIVFDLDYTLWPFWVDTDVRLPFRLESNNVIYDANQKKVECFPDVPQMLHMLKCEGYHLGVASRTDTPPEATKLIELFGWKNYFQYSEIYPGNKTTHFTRFQNASRLPYVEMLFFDDEARNIHDVSQLGVTCIHAPKGMSFSLLQKGLDIFRTNRE